MTVIDILESTLFQTIDYTYSFDSKRGYSKVLGKETFVLELFFFNDKDLFREWTINHDSLTLIG